MTIQTQPPLWKTSHKIILAVLLLIQFSAAYFIGTGHWLTNDALSQFPPIAITAVIPVVLFVATYLLSERFRSFILAQDIRRLTTFQMWRVVGFVFLPLYAYDILPGLFALPAGIGDVAVGLIAAVVIAKMDKDPTYATTAAYRRFQYIGLLDFVIAIVTSGLVGGAFPALISNGISSSPLDVWPLNIFPSFVVPAFIILQLSALLNVRNLRRSARHPADTSLQAAE